MSVGARLNCAGTERPGAVARLEHRLADGWRRTGQVDPVGMVLFETWVRARNSWRAGAVLQRQARAVVTGAGDFDSGAEGAHRG